MIYNRNYQSSEISIDKLTHLYYAFANVTDIDKVYVIFNKIMSVLI